MKTKITLFGGEFVPLGDGQVFFQLDCETNFFLAPGKQLSQWAAVDLQSCIPTSFSDSQISFLPSTSCGMCISDSKWYHSWIWAFWNSGSWVKRGKEKGMAGYWSVSKGTRPHFCLAHLWALSIHWPLCPWRDDIGIIVSGTINITLWLFKWCTNRKKLIYVQL